MPLPESQFVCPAWFHVPTLNSVCFNRSLSRLPLRCLLKDAWSAEEDALLQRLYEELGTAWSCISKQIANRTPQQCRGRWCILSGLGKNKVRRCRGADEGRRAYLLRLDSRRHNWHGLRDARLTVCPCPQMPSPAAPQTPHPERGRLRKSTGAIAVAAFPSARHEQAPPLQQPPAGQACPSTITRRGAVTELPALPASACGPRLCEAPTVQQARRTRAAARISTAAGMEPLSAGGGEEQGGAAAGALAPRTQPRLARHRTRLGGVREAEGGAAPVTSEEQESHGRQPGPEGEDEEPAPSATEDESEGQEVQDASDCQEDDVNGNTRTRRGEMGGRSMPWR